MSHNLNQDQKSGEHAMAYANYEKPWHGLGQPVEGLMTSAEALTNAHLDFEVVKKPLFIKRVVQQGGRLRNQYNEVPGKFEIVRMDTEEHLGVVGGIYTVFQNKDAFSFVDSIVKQGEAVYDTVGALYNGSRVWMLVKLPGYVQVKKDIVEKFLLITNSHDGSTPIVVKFTPVRVVCWNTLSAALHYGGKTNVTVKVRHTRNARVKLEEAKRVLGISTKYYDQLQQYYGEMAGFQMNKKLLQKYIVNVLPVQPPKNNVTTILEKQRHKVAEIFETSPAIKGTDAQGNLWGAYNAVTEWIQYHKKIIERQEGARMSNLMIDDYSTSHIIRQRALDAAISLMN